MPEVSRGQTFHSSPSIPPARSASDSLRMNGESSGTISRNASAEQEASTVESPRPSREHTKEGKNEQRDGAAQLHEHTYNGKHNSRRSGGFLVNSIPVTNVGDGAIGRVIHNSTSVKGKAREYEPVLGLQRNKTRQVGHRPKPSIGSSPLSTEVTNVAPLRNPGSDRISSEHHIRQDGHPSMSDHHALGATHSVAKDAPTKVFNSNTDPAQIVNLALNLSESRRRHASIGRLSPIDSLGSNRRFVSSGQLGHGYLPSPALASTGGSLKYRLQQQRGSNNLSPRSAQFERLGNGAYTDRSRKSEDSIDDLPIHDFHGLPEDQHTADPSDATLLRADKARTALELSYEYRRLLQYLPLLPAPPRSRPGTAKIPSKVMHDRPQILGRVYNPLQYVRNRKVRGRERQTFDAEVDGWKDLDSVRNWVNKVADQREGYNADVGDEKPLPAFRQMLERQDENDPLSSPSLTSSNPVPILKPSRPRSDWNTTSWDLLADAYWLESGDHKKLVEDRNGQKLFPQTVTDFTQVLRLSRDLSRLAERRSGSVPRSSHSPDKPTLVMEPLDSTKERGRQLHRLRDSITSLHEYSSSQDRKTRWHRKLVRSQSSSSSEDSLPVSLSRQSRLHGRGSSRERQDSAVLERQVLDLLAKEGRTAEWDLPHHNTVPSANVPQTFDDGGPAHLTNGSDTLSAEARLSSKTNRKLFTRSSPSQDRTAIDDGKPESEPRISLDELDTTGHSSPADIDVVPSIAINLSPPHFRSPSPRKPLPFNNRALNFRQRKEKERVAEADFALGSASPISTFQSGKDDRNHDIDATKSPTDGLLSSKSAEWFGKELRRRRSDSRLTKVATEHREPEMKLRTFFNKRGHRLAGLVSNPVTKVGDLLWRRDGSNPPPAVVSPVTAYLSEASETEEDFSDSALKPLRAPSSADIHSEVNEASHKSRNGEPLTYHLKDLPSFRHQPKNGEECDHNGQAPQGDDHIARQQQILRDRGRSRGFDRLAPPILDMTSASRSRSPSLTRVATHETIPTDKPRRSSTSPSNMSRRLPNHPFLDITGLPEKIGHGGPPVTGLASIDIHRHSSTKRLESKGERHWSIADCDVSAVRGNITQRDFTRVRALLLSSGVKACGIVRHFEGIADPLPTLFSDIEAVTKVPFPSLPRFQAHNHATRLVVKVMDEHNTKLRQSADNLSHKSIESFHERLRSLDCRISTSLTPLVRSAADDADALNTELASSYRLSIRRLNDSIDQILRRKRRRFRWVRNGGYLLLEWLLLCAMWCVWFIVVIIRSMINLVRGVWKFGRWLLWL
ncbi:hypothetical protein MMC13_000646 [Lambiella insularis]|nr:hypothetical protein [Lambiella insularis]